MTIMTDHTATETRDNGDDAIFEELEKEIGLENRNDWLRDYEQKRLREFQKELESGHAMENDEGHGGGVLFSAQGDREILDWTTTMPKVIVHFFHPEYESCSILDQHLKSLAVGYPFVRWARVSALEAPFLINKLKVKVLPYLAIFSNGIKIDHMIGFEDLGSTNDFSLRTLTRRIARSGILKSNRHRKLKGPTHDDSRDHNNGDTDSDS